MWYPPTKEKENRENDKSFLKQFGHQPYAIVTD